jgi:hypothetical protein
MVMKDLLRNLHVVTTHQTWSLFVKQVSAIPEATPETAFRQILKMAIQTFPAARYSDNMKALRKRWEGKAASVKAWTASIGLPSEAETFQIIPAENRLVFSAEKCGVPFLEDMIQIAYPECMYKPFNWMPFSRQVVFEGQNKSGINIGDVK